MMKRENPNATLNRKQWRERLNKIQRKITVTFESLSDRRAVAPSMLGFTQYVAAEDAGLTIGQVRYRQKLARTIYGVAKGQSFSKQWRNGTSPFAQQVQSRLMPSLLAKLARDLPKARLHPAAEVVSLPEPPGPTVAQAARALHRQRRELRHAA